MIGKTIGMKTTKQKMKSMKIEIWDIDKIQPYEANVKIHDDKQVEKIANSIQRFGWDQPIVVDKNGVIIKGHGRRLAAIKLGYTKVPVLVRDDLTEDQVKAARVADNRVAMGDIDTEMLQKELQDIDFDLGGIFDAKELDFLKVDLTEINEDAIEDNIVEEMERQSEEMSDHIKTVDLREVRIADALGFKKVRGEDQRPIARFMARIEEETGKQGAEAFVRFAQNYIGK